MKASVTITYCQTCGATLKVRSVTYRWHRSVNFSDLVPPDGLNDGVLALRHQAFLVLTVEDHSPGQATIHNILEGGHRLSEGGGGQVGLEIAGVAGGYDEAVDDPYSNDNPESMHMQIISIVG